MLSITITLNALGLGDWVCAHSIGIIEMYYLHVSVQPLILFRIYAHCISHFCDREFNEVINMFAVNYYFLTFLATRVIKVNPTTNK